MTVHILTSYSSVKFEVMVARRVMLAIRPSNISGIWNSVQMVYLRTTIPSCILYYNFYKYGITW
jgi:hypothetical protein